MKQLSTNPHSNKNINVNATKDDKKPVGSPLLRSLLKRTEPPKGTGNILADIL